AVVVVHAVVALVAGRARAVDAVGCVALAVRILAAGITDTAVPARSREAAIARVGAVRVVITRVAIRAVAALVGDARRRRAGAVRVPRARFALDGHCRRLLGALDLVDELLGLDRLLGIRGFNVFDDAAAGQ